MREIKFRAWDGTEMYTPIIGDKGELFRSYRDVEDFNPAINDDLMRYTGLKDKDGREIYEGDVLDVTTELLTNLGRTRTGKMHTTYYEVLWNVECWATKVLRAKTLVIGHVSNGLKIPAGYGKVIGNIYENPELIA